jgi:undecaprenyl-diphosphatase
VNEKWRQADQRAYLWIQGWTRRNQGLDRLLLHVARFGPLWMLAAVAWVIVGGTARDRAWAYASLAAAIAARLFNGRLRKHFYRRRPYHTLGTVPLLWKGEDASFPSNHAAGAFALAVPLWLHGGQLGGILLLFAALLALSRVYVGVHYPSDVIAGAAVGAVSGWICASILSL